MIINCTPIICRVAPRRNDQVRPTHNPHLTDQLLYFTNSTPDSNTLIATPDSIALIATPDINAYLIATPILQSLQQLHQTRAQSASASATPRSSKKTSEHKVIKLQYNASVATEEGVATAISILKTKTWYKYCIAKSILLLLLLLSKYEWSTVYEDAI